MAGEISDAKKATDSKSEWRQRAIFVTACALVIFIFAWISNPGYLDLASPDAKDSYYNLLVQGFRDGQLNLKRDASPALGGLENPYDSTVNAPYVWDKHHLAFDMSYYKGKLYLYFGVTPALVLFWPYVTVTGHYLSHKDAVVIFYSFGFLAAAGILYSIWRLYFPEVRVWIAVSGVLALGLASSILVLLASCDVYEVAISCGFAFSMLALAGVFGSLHCTKWQNRWLLLASLAYGLAIGARPTLLFGAPMLLIPVLRVWSESNWRDSWRRISWCFFSATVPLVLVGLGLMLYNYLRFDNPLEFGWHYQLVNGRNYGVQQFSWHYLWFNFRFYFLEPVRWTSGFPFLKPIPILPLPPGHFGVGIPYGGTLSNYPIVWLALASWLAVGSRLVKRASGLTWFIGAVFYLFAVCASTLCFFTAASTRYQFDFLPYLMLLASIGILCLEQTLAHLNTGRYVARGIWCLLLVYSIVFNAFAGVDARANANYIAGNYFSNQGDMNEAIEYFRKASETEPGSAEYHFALGNALLQSGQIDEAISQYQDALKISPNYAQADNNIAYAFMKKGETDQAITYFQEALKNSPSYEAYYNLADAFRRSGNVPQAIAGYQKTIDLQPGFIPAEKSLAWMLATCPDPAFRDGARAVALAEKANQLAGGRDPGILRVLAAAYAEAGRFNEAVAAAKKAQFLAAAESNTALANELQIEIGLYQKGTSYNSMKK